MLSREQVVSLDKRHVWHPYTAMDVYEREIDPLVIERAQGAHLFDMDGRRYIDANASWWLSAFGHNHPRLVQALKRQAEQLCHCSLAGTTHPQAAMLARELAEVAPAGLTRVFFSDDGSTAVEAALKMAVQFFAQRKGSERKRRFVALDGAFHGETIGASSLGGVEVFRRPFASVLFDCVRVPSPADDAAFGAAFAVLREVMESEHDELAAVVLEPLVQGAAGMQLYDARYLQQVRALCSELNVLMIADEVFTGYGRTGSMWACDQAQVSPDILCVGKAFSGGMLPMAATLATERVFEGFFGGRSRAFLYGHSYSGNPLGAAIAREVLAIFRDESVAEQVRRKAAVIARAFEQMGSIPGVRRPRSLGMIGALDLELACADSAPRDFVESAADLSSRGYLGSAGWRVYDAARRRGAYLRPLGDTIYICPALTIDDEVLAELLDIVSASIQEVAGGQP
jgi:adenosylmethionine-8-amino-7-oxononanoate aminotransferase